MCKNKATIQQEAKEKQVQSTKILLCLSGIIQKKGRLTGTEMLHFPKLSGMGKYRNQ
jgi:hypothetical protein